VRDKPGRWEGEKVEFGSRNAEVGKERDGKLRRWEGEKLRRWEKAGLRNEDREYQHI